MQNAGRKLLLTRPEAASLRFLSSFEAEAGAVTAIVAPVLRLVDRPMAPLTQIPAAVILTSENGARALTRAGLPKGIRAWCVGARTAEIARLAGAEAIEAGPDAARLLPTLLAQAGEGPFLHLRGQYAAAEIAALLRAEGRLCEERIVYDQETQALTSEARAVLNGTAPVLVPLFSPRSARAVAEQGPFEAPLHVVAMSAAVARAAEGLSAQVEVVDVPDGASMLRQSLARWRELA